MLTQSKGAGLLHGSVRPKEDKAPLGKILLTTPSGCPEPRLDCSIQPELKGTIQRTETEKELLLLHYSGELREEAAAWTRNRKEFCLENEKEKQYKILLC